jgi:hypothetical protein
MFQYNVQAMIVPIYMAVRWQLRSFHGKLFVINGNFKLMDKTIRRGNKNEITVKTARKSSVENGVKKWLLLLGCYVS